jgi:transposase
MNNIASSTTVLAYFYVVNPRSMLRQYKDYLSDFKAWGQKSHAKDWLLFAKNRGGHLSHDETAFSNGDLYTILTNKKAKGKKEAIVAIVKGTKAESVIRILHKIPLKQRKKVREVTLVIYEWVKKWCFLNIGSTRCYYFISF